MKSRGLLLPQALMAVPIVLSGCATETTDQSWYVGMDRQQVFDPPGTADRYLHGSTTCTPGSGGC